MLEQLLNFITYENLLLYFKEISVSPERKILRAGQKSELGNFAVELRNGNNIIKISDSEVLKNILPVEVSEKMFGQGNLTLLAFVFALRHKITILNLLFHMSSLSLQTSNDNFTNYLKQLDTKLNFQFSILYGEHEKFLHSDFWGNVLQLPVIGFSAVGCLFLMRDVHLCRAFDHYDIVSCSNHLQKLFCDKHIIEKFWENNFFQEPSTQAKMFRFYLDKNNFKEFDEASLEKILNNFFHKYTNYNSNYYKKFKSESVENTQFTLEFYNFLSVKEMQEFGLEELRKRFLEKAKQLHPDVGGSQELFREARKNYELLRNLL